MWPTILLVLVFVLLIAWMAAYMALQANDLSHHDQASGEPRNKNAPPSEEHHGVVDIVTGLPAGTRGNAGIFSRHMLTRMRSVMDSLGDYADLGGIQICQVNTPKGEWVLSPDTKPGKRLLYIHGGAFMAGSPQSHRTITTKFARMRSVAVFAVDYRLLPEHNRLDCLSDCQAAYRWLLENGPEEPQKVEEMIVAGDSAGGNLALVLAAWARDEGLRSPDSVIALAPHTDNTFSSPSLGRNRASDPILGRTVGRLTAVPRPLMYWINWASMGIKPIDPRVSPIHGELRDLPPTLIHASEAELLLDDARRYTNKAASAGSPVYLATWKHMVHVWHIFEPNLPEAKQAFEHINDFLQAHLQN